MKHWGAGQICHLARFLADGNIEFFKGNGSLHVARKVEDAGLLTTSHRITWGLAKRGDTGLLAKSRWVKVSFGVSRPVEQVSNIRSEEKK